MLARLAPALLVTAIACGGNYPAAGKPDGHPDKPVVIDVEASALPYKVLRAHGGAEVSADDLWREIGEAQAVCVGETHDNPHDHWAQLEVIEHLSRGGAADLAVGMEMFQRPFQGVLDDYAAGRIDEAALLSRSDWKERWGFDFAFYRPQLHLAVGRHAALLALNIETELKKKISAAGSIEALPEADRARVPELVLDDAQHRAWFDAEMAGMGEAHGHGDVHGDGKPEDPAAAKAMADKIYRGQVLWDETMADTAARWLTAVPGRRIVILAGKGHCHDSALVRRITRRGVARAVSIQPLIDDGEGNVAAALADPINDYLLVMRAR
ncbi:MAG TPA: ChaN family lipoprotein [Kofleriaceae bacterium]|jgi:uncharacterized iron-regulated protein|nr:ChaN family lipoprotein [Kofleriaceae bacterium]